MKKVKRTSEFQALALTSSEESSSDSDDDQRESGIEKVKVQNDQTFADEEPTNPARIQNELTKNDDSNLEDHTDLTGTVHGTSTLATNQEEVPLRTTKVENCPELLKSIEQLSLLQINVRTVHTIAGYLEPLANNGPFSSDADVQKIDLETESSLEHLSNWSSDLSQLANKWPGNNQNPANMLATYSEGEEIDLDLDPDVHSRRSSSPVKETEFLQDSVGPGLLIDLEAKAGSPALETQGQGDSLRCPESNNLLSALTISQGDIGSSSKVMDPAGKGQHDIIGSLGHPEVSEEEMDVDQDTVQLLQNTGFYTNNDSFSAYRTNAEGHRSDSDCSLEDYLLPQSSNPVPNEKILNPTTENKNARALKEVPRKNFSSSSSSDSDVEVAPKKKADPGTKPTEIVKQRSLSETDSDWDADLGFTSPKKPLKKAKLVTDRQSHDLVSSNETEESDWELDCGLKSSEKTQGPSDNLNEASNKKQEPAPEQVKAPRKNIRQKLEERKGISVAKVQEMQDSNPDPINSDYPAEIPLVNKRVGIRERLAAKGNGNQSAKCNSAITESREAAGNSNFSKVLSHGSAPIVKIPPQSYIIAGQIRNQNSEENKLPGLQPVSNSGKTHHSSSSNGDNKPNFEKDDTNPSIRRTNAANFNFSPPTNPAKAGAIAPVGSHSTSAPPCDCHKLFCEYLDTVGTKDVREKSCETFIQDFVRQFKEQMNHGSPIIGGEKNDCQSQMREVYECLAKIVQKTEPWFVQNVFISKNSFDKAMKRVISSVKKPDFKDGKWDHVFDAGCQIVEESYRKRNDWIIRQEGLIVQAALETTFKEWELRLKNNLKGRHLDENQLKDLIHNTEKHLTNCLILAFNPATREFSQDLINQWQKRVVASTDVVTRMNEENKRNLEDLLQDAEAAAWKEFDGCLKTNISGNQTALDEILGFCQSSFDAVVTGDGEQHVQMVKSKWQDVCVGLTRKFGELQQQQNQVLAKSSRNFQFIASNWNQTLLDISERNSHLLQNYLVVHIGLEKLSYGGFVANQFWMESAIMPEALERIGIHPGVGSKLNSLYEYFESEYRFFNVIVGSETNVRAVDRIKIVRTIVSRVRLKLHSFTQHQFNGLILCLPQVLDKKFLREIDISFRTGRWNFKEIDIISDNNAIALHQIVTTPTTPAKFVVANFLESKTLKTMYEVSDEHIHLKGCYDVPNFFTKGMIWCKNLLLGETKEEKAILVAGKPTDEAMKQYEKMKDENVIQLPEQANFEFPLHGAALIAMIKTSNNNEIQLGYVQNVTFPNWGYQ